MRRVCLGERRGRHVGDAGLGVTLCVQGSPGHLSPGIDLTAYRVVQEALTNALARDGAGGSADVELRWEDDRIEIVVNDNGYPWPSSNGDGPETGLIAMRERVAVYGGKFTATRGPHGAPSVRVRLPREAAS